MTTTMYPYLSYRDAASALRFLEEAFGAGARVVYAPQNTEWGTRRYQVLDPEGYEWSFGSYQPGTAGGS